MQSAMLSIKRYFASPVIQLALVALASLLIYVFGFLLPINLLNLYDQPRLDAYLMIRQGVTGYMRVVVSLLGVWVLYWLGYRISRKVQGRSAWVIVIFGMLVFSAVYLFTAPFDAADIYDNILHGRILGVYSANPFHQVIADYPNDPFYAYTAWKHSQSAYGPIWELLAGLTARLAGDGIIANVLAFKLLPGFFYLGSVWLVVLYLRRNVPEQALSGAFLLGWNPMALYETWGNGHNDMAMAFWILVAVWWISRRQYSLAAISLMVGTLIKFIPILLIPAVLWIGWRDLQKASLRFAFIAQTAIGSGLLTALFYFPFWDGTATLDIGRRMQLYTTSIPTVLFRALTPSLGIQDAGSVVSLFALGLLFLFVLYQTFSAEKLDPVNGYLQSAFNVLAFYLLVVCLSFHQWYSLWLIALIPLVTNGNRRLALLFGFWALTQKLVFGPLLVKKILNASPEQAIWMEALLALGVLGVPWLYALRNIWMEKQMRNLDHAT
jgi:fumarate reductase subunit D